MGSYLGVLVTWTVLGAAWLLTHLALVYRSIVRSSPLGGLRWLALVPPLAPWTAWRAGDRRLAVVWGVVGVVYVASRLVGRAMLSSRA